MESDQERSQGGGRESDEVSGNRAPNPREHLFVFGPPKSGSSSLVGMLNSSPEVFLLYEAELAEEEVQTGPGRERRRRTFLRRFPELRSAFEEDGFCSYEIISSRFGQFRYLGDKLVGFRDLEPYRGHRAIYCVRDIRTWLCKDQIDRRYGVSERPTSVALEYVIHFLTALKVLDQVHVVRMEDLILDNRQVVVQLADFLGIDAAQMERWWEKVGRYDADDPKAHWPWWGWHASSTVPPRHLDVVVSLRPHPFWDELIPIFEKYYRGRYDPAEIDADLAALRRISVGADSIEELYERRIWDPVVESESPAWKSWTIYQQVRQRVVKPLRRRLSGE